MAFSSLLLIRSFCPFTQQPPLSKKKPSLPHRDSTGSFLIYYCLSVRLSASLSYILSLCISLYLSVCLNYFLAVLHTFLAGSLACLPCLVCFRFLTLTNSSLLHNFLSSSYFFPQIQCPLLVFQESSPVFHSR